MAIESSLVIITLNRPALLEESLASLELQSRQLDEIVVVDNGPSEETARVVREFESRLPVRRVEESRRGYGFARNRGLQEARGDILLSMDDDCYAHKDWVGDLLRPLNEGEAEIAGGSRTCGTKGLAARLDYLCTDAPVLHPELPRGYVDALSTSNLAMLRSVVDRVGEFDESLATCEDRDFCRRARSLGYRILFEPSATVRHQPPIKSFGDYTRRMVRYGKGTSQYFLRHPREEILSMLFPSQPMLRLAFWPLLAGLGTGYLAYRNWPRCPDALLLSPLIFVGQVCWHWGGYLATRQEKVHC